VSITISADDPRSIRAIEIAADAAKWQATCTPEGEDAFWVPSQSQRERYYLVSRTVCDCPDFVRSEAADRACKHILAVRLYTELVRAQGSGAPQRRGHLRVVH